MRQYLTAGLCLAVLGTATAPGQVREGRVDRDSTKAALAPRRVTDVLGSQVGLRGGESLGKVTDMLMGEDGRVSYLLVRHEGGLLPVPWGALRATDVGRGLQVASDVRPERVRLLVFREGSWPDFASEAYRRSAGDVWGAAAMGMPGDRRGTGTATGTGRGGATGTGAGTATDRAAPRERGNPLLPGNTGNTEDRKPPAGPRD